MSLDSTSPGVNRRESSWAKPVEKLSVSDLPSEAINLNVEGRHLTGPLRGFGQLWQKTYRIRLRGADVTPEQLIQVRKEKFPSYWPEGNQFYGPLKGIAPGDVAVLNLASPGGMKLSTGIMVIYADDVSFSFMTPEGHMFAGMITFSAYEEDSTNVVQIQVLIRASDPLYELGCRIGYVHKNEDEFWNGTLQNLAASFGVEGHVQLQTFLVDPRVQWKEAGNIWQNAAIRSGLYAPIAFVRKTFSRER
jgi:hypothetical protein